MADASAFSSRLGGGSEIYARFFRIQVPQFSPSAFWTILAPVVPATMAGLRSLLPPASQCRMVGPRLRRWASSLPP